MDQYSNEINVSLRNECPALYYIIINAIYKVVDWWVYPIWNTPQK